jgi:RNA methyltransferase, TrmH family
MELKYQKPMLSKSRLKYIQSLAHKKFREASPEFIIEGPKIVEEFLVNQPGLINEIYALDKWADDAKNLLRSVAPIKNIPVTEMELAKISLLTTPNQVLALVKKINPPDGPILKDRFTLVLDNIQDPGNLGTIIRTADWFGIGQIVCSTESVDLYNPKVIQSTMGSILRVQVFYLDIETWIPQQKDIPVFCTALDGKNLFEMQPVKEGLMIIGNESKGVRPSIMNAAKEKISIPRYGGAESLNAAVAAGIVMAQLRKSC